MVDFKWVESSVMVGALGIILVLIGLYAWKNAKDVSDLLGRIINNPVLNISKSDDPELKRIYVQCVEQRNAYNLSQYGALGVAGIGGIAIILALVKRFAFPG